MSPAPELSVIVVSYQCRRLLADCLDSLAGERDSLSMQVVVVDNASTDGTDDMVRDTYPWVEFHPAPGNVGFSRANNLGLDLVKSDAILLLNPDTVVPRGSLVAALDAFRRKPEIGMLGVKLVRPDGSLDHACKRGFPSLSSAAAHFAGLTAAFPRSPRLAQYTAGHLDPDEEGAVDAVNGAFMLVRRAAVDDVGPLDDRFWMYGEDIDWCYRFWQCGWPVWYWPAVSVTHIKGGSATPNRSWQANQAFYNSMVLFYRKHHGARRTVPAVRAMARAMLLGSAVRSSLARRGAARANG